MKKAFSVILTLAMLISCIPSGFAAAAPGKLLLATLSDLHYYPESLAKYKGEAFYTYLKGSNAVYDDMDGILDSALAALKKDADEKGLKYVVITGDLTTNGEYAGHIALAEKLHDFEKKTGLRVFVMNGNHDINNSDASEFTTPDLSKNKAKITTPSEFYEIYRDFGYDEATAYFAGNIKEAAAKGIPGALSYAVSVDGGYRFIMIDAGKYAKGNTKSGEDEHETGGRIPPELLDWILSQAQAAKKAGETPIAFTHWNLSEMNYMHGEVLQGFVIDEAYKLQEIFADAGIHYVFSGHQHVSDIDVTWSDAGEPLYSCITPTLTQYPFCFRETAFTRDASGRVSAEFKQYSADIAKKVKSRSGQEYTQPYYLTTGCAKQIGDTLDASEYLLNMIKNILSDYINEIRDKKSVITFLRDEFGFDLREWLCKYIPENIELGGDVIFSVDNIMRFADDLDEQLREQFINDPDKLLWPSLKSALQNILNVKISDVPCTKFTETYGFGSADKGGTIGDLFLTVLVNMYPGNENISDDPFIQDVLKTCGTTEFVDLIFDSAVKYVVEDVVYDVILGNTELHLDTVFTQSGSKVSVFLRTLYASLMAIISSEIYKPTSLSDFISKLSKLSAILGSTKSASYKTLIETVLGTGYISYGKNLREVADTLLDTYLGDVQKQAAAYQLYVVAEGIFNDPDKDWDVTYSYSGAQKVTPTVEDMQLPNDVTVSLGADASTSVNIRWMTKYSVKGSDIAVFKTDGKPVSAKIKAETESSEISGFGFDFGTFGILPWSREVNIHTVRISGLTPGTAYKFRIGDFTKGFVTEGSFHTADNNDRFTFAFLSDPAGVSPATYQNFAKAAKAASGRTKLDFILHGGNSVFSGENEDQWGWALNGARDTLLNVPVQYVSGTGDIGDSSPVTKHFALTDIPTYAETMKGVFYSFDYENAHFTVLNTNDLDEDGTLTINQLKWLDADLSGCDSEWRVLVMNTPLYGVNAVNNELRTQLLKIINDYAVNLVLGGTDGVYSRTHVIDEGTPLPNTDIMLKNVNGKTYEAYINTPGFISVNGCYAGSFFGAKAPEGNLYKATDAAGEPVFTVFSVSGDTLAADTYRLNSDGSTTVIDSFAITTQYTLAKLGDVDIDDKITAADARLALRAAVGLDALAAVQKIRADVDTDKKITAADARLILRAAVGLEKIAPEYINYMESELKNIGF